MIERQRGSLSGGATILAAPANSRVKLAARNIPLPQATKKSPEARRFGYGYIDTAPLARVS
eukprot:scaffold41126_cov33-Phaeocystis_antarctica.AAC.1